MTRKRLYGSKLAATTLVLGALAWGCSSGGTGGSTGTAGTGGGAGTTGTAGTTGGAGTTGSAGTTGTAGTTGAAGHDRRRGDDGRRGHDGRRRLDQGRRRRRAVLRRGLARGRRASFTLTTTSLKIVDGGLVFPAASSAPMNQSPALTWSGAPAGKLSYALSMYDATLKNTHWILWDIGPGETMLMANLPRGAMPTTPAGASQKSAFGGTPGYEGPGGGGVDNYEIVLWALKVSKLDVGNMTLNAIHATLLPAQSLGTAQILAKGTRMGL